MVIAAKVCWGAPTVFLNTNCIGVELARLEDVQVTCCVVPACHCAPPVGEMPVPPDGEVKIIDGWVVVTAEPSEIV